MLNIEKYKKELYKKIPEAQYILQNPNKDKLKNAWNYNIFKRNEKEFFKFLEESMEREYQKNGTN